MPNSPLFSIIIPCLDCEGVLQRCLRSIAHQNYKNYEVIIKTVNDSIIIDEYLKSSIITKIKVVKKKDSGISEAWNQALRYVKGDWVLFLGADDILYDSNVLKRAANYIYNISDQVELIYGKVGIINSMGVEYKKCGEPLSQTRIYLKSFMSIPHQGLFHRSTIFNRGLKFDNSLRYAADYDLVLKAISANNMRFYSHYISKMSDGGITGNPLNGCAIFIEYRQAQIQNDNMRVSFRWVIGYMKCFIKIIIYKVFGHYFLVYLQQIYRGKILFWSKRDPD